MARGNFFGYDIYMICDGSLRNVSRDGRIIGFAVDLRIANYRGYLLSQVEDVRISVDGEWAERDDLRLEVNGSEYAVGDMATVTDNRWGLLDRATLTWLRDGGLAAGEHEVEVEEHIRASYIPMTAVAFSIKTLTLAASECPVEG